MPPYRLLSWIALTLIASIVVAPARADPLPSTSHNGLPRWHWVGHVSADQRVRLDLIRAVVTIESSPNDETRVELSPRAAPADAERMWIDVAAKDGTTLIQDRYSQRAPWAMFGAECLPPADERGDFWLVPATLNVTVYASPGVRVDVDVREGKVTDNRR